MKHYKKLIAGIIGLMLVAFLGGAAIAAEKVTIKGKINESQQLVTEDGKVYKIADTQQGIELADLTNEKVAVKGTVTEKEGVMTIEVSEYEVIE